MLIPATLAAVLPPRVSVVPVNDGGVGDRGDARSDSADRHLRRWHTLAFEPLPFQKDIIHALVDRCEKRDAKGLLLLPTGAGKTSVASAALLSDLARCDAAEALAVWIAPQRELLAQAKQCAERLWSAGFGPDSLDLRVVVGSSASPPPSGRHSVIFATPQSAATFFSSHRVTSRITHAVFDEAHHLGADRFGEAWKLVTRSDDVRMAIGLSATPIRGDEASFSQLRELFSNRLLLSGRLGRDPIATLQQDGVLARVDVRVMAGVPEYIRRAGVQRGGNASSLVSDPNYWSACIDEITKCKGPSIAFYPDTSTGRLAASHLRSRDFRAEYIDGAEPWSTRVSVLERFRDGSTHCVVSVGLLFEGVDLPVATDAVVVYRIASAVRLSQIVGRVIRGPALGGTPSAVIHCADVTTASSIGDPNSGRDYAAYWSRGMSL